jgi:formylglycine-generating enzyme required for sulfatase activity
LQPGVFGSRFPAASGTFWTLVNRNEYDVSGPQIEISSQPGMHYYDLWHGTELTPAVVNGKATLSFDLEPLGYGAVLATRKEEPVESLRNLLSYMAERSRRPLANYSRDWSPVAQTLVEIPVTRSAQSPPENMVRISAGDYDFQVSGIEIEGGNDPGVDVQYPWEDTARRFHRHRMQIHSFYIDRTPVTNAEFAKFLNSTHYRPKDDHNFLRPWKNGTYPQGWDNKPVTWVSLEDARAYAAWTQKRLPHEWEWQYAAQGTDGRLYPWGNDWNVSAVPIPEKGRSLRSPDEGQAHPQGASPFNVMDLVGNIWQWTDEYQDEHTRAAILRGGSYYQPQGSMWYFPQAYRNNQHGKLLLMAPSKDRSGTVGFRCVVDAEASR